MADLAFCLERGGPITERGPKKVGGPGACPPGIFLEILVANGAF